MASLWLLALAIVGLIAKHHHVKGYRKCVVGRTRNNQRVTNHVGGVTMAFNNDATNNVVVREAANNDITNVAKFLSVSMYANDPIPVGQQKELYRLEFQDLKSRYSALAAVKGFYSSLLIAEISGEIVGVVGLDCQILNRELKKFKKLTVNSLAYLDNDEEEIVIVLANLAVGADQRRKGVGKLLLQKCEAYAKSYIGTSNQGQIDNASIYLTVDSENQKAIKLYKKNGYKVVFEDENATCVVSGEYSLQTKDCVNLCMKKTIGNRSGNLFGGLFSIF